MDTPATLSRNEIIEAVRDCLEEFEFPVAASAVGADMTREEMVYAVKEGLNSLDLPRGHAATSSSDNEEVLSRLEDLLGYIKLEFRAVSQEAKDNVAANGRDTEQVLDATKDGLENLRIAIESYVERATGAAGQEEFMEGILKTMDEFRQDITSSITQSGETSREQLQIELESLREIVNSSMVPATPQQGNNKEIMEALHNAVTSLRQEILRPRQETSEILDALQDGLNELKVGIDRVTNKPVDLTANDEILDALKSGLDSVRSDIETIRDNSNDKAVATMSNLAPENDAVIPADMVKQDDIKNLEVLITQLRIKLEAMEPEPTQSVQKEDLTRLEDILRNVQQGVEEIGNREPPAAAETARDAPADAPATSGDAASKDDVQAIETILRNTKARLDDLIDGEQALRKEHLDVVEALILETRESMSAIVGQMESMSHKEDFATMETLLTQVTTGFDEMKERTPSEEESTDKVSKSDVEAVETVVLEIKGLLDGIRDVDFNALPKKEDLANVETIVKEAAEKLQKIESLNESSSTALEKRQEELDSASERVAEVKTFLEAFQETVKTKLDDGSTGIEALGKLLESMGEKFDKNENVGTDLKEMMDTMKSEFQESKEVFAGAKLESDEKLHEATESLGTKIGEKIEELVAKYDEFQAILDEKSQAGEARDIVTEAAVVGTKAVADELKLLVDTLGTTVTESMEKMEEASKTVFDKVEDLVTRSDEHHSTDKAEHEQTRDRVQQALSIVEGLQGDVSDFQPKILEAVKEVLALVGQHFEHSKSSATDIQDKIVEAKPTEEFMQAMLPPPDKFDDSEIQEKLNRLVEQKYDDSEIRERLERLLAAKYDDASVHEKLDMLVEARYDDTSVQEKLDRLVTDSDTTGQAMSRLESLDKVHETVVKTANEISEFLASQTQRIADEHEDREKTLQDTTISLERKRAEKDHVEASILSLKDEEDRLRNSVMTLRTEQESLIRQKARLTGDVSSLETALQLRKEELAEMEHRGERLERRILEGVMDHSRVLLMSKSTRGGESMNRKRVRKPANEDVVAARPSPKPAVNMALSSKRNLAPPGQPGMARRIVSLSQINNNSPTGGVKRSQSVRTPAGGVKSLRKRSWGGDAAPGFADIDKENISVRETVEEVDETEVPADDGNESDTGTLRRSSLVTSSTDLYTDSETGYSERDDDMASEWTDSMVSGPASSIAEATGGEMMDGNEMVVYGQ
jgi:DNA repair exonuclease SbcCD ATPase subunit